MIPSFSLLENHLLHSSLNHLAFPLDEARNAGAGQPETHNSAWQDVSLILDPDNEFGCGLSNAR